MARRSITRGHARTSRRARKDAHTSTSNRSPQREGKREAIAGGTTKKRRRGYTHAHLPVSRRYSYTPELLADGRRRYEQTDECIIDIAADFGVHKTTFQRLANRLGWVRFAPQPRDLPAAARLAREAEALLAERKATPTPNPSPQGGGEHSESAAHSGLFPPPLWGRARERGPNESATETPTRPPSAGDLPLSGGGKEQTLSGGGSGEAAPPSGAGNSEIVARLLAGVENELTAVETMRAQLKRVPQSPEDAERTARTLAQLTTTFERLQRLQHGAPLPLAQDSYDDMPADLDEFREALAQRIEAILAREEDEDGAR